MYEIILIWLKYQSTPKLNIKLYQHVALERGSLWGSSQAARHQTLTLTFGGSTPLFPAKNK